MKYLIIPFFLITQLIYSQEYKLVYTQQENNNDNILLADESGPIKQITSHRSKDSSPVISPDGKRMVFTSERVGWWKIWTMNLETVEFKQLTFSSSAEYSPSWSPDGKSIVFVSSRDGNQEIYTMNSEGKNQTNITNNSASDVMPFWGNDNKIYYSTEINGIYQLARMAPDGNNKEVLTSGKINILMPSLSNDRSKILFYGDFKNNYEIGILDLKTNKITQITSDPLLDMRPRWSADNKKIVFERGNKGNNHHVFIMNTDGSQIKQITKKGYNYSPSFMKINVLND
ncbi:TolB family protein [Fulvivirga lutimaris]|uniref:TolB family protein n=1 Tax=Fulvivirga lutimaris TaxID=1819566 RepID=UPI0012BD154B|nr:DUF5050 domain-containing protein [Fulvivirga lutimaris]MTI39849.1 DUF5050 domain-containing protein [Fulvivirga lutimaris]